MSAIKALLRYNRQNVDMSRIAGSSLFICALTAFAGAYLELTRCAQHAEFSFCKVIPIIIIIMHILYAIFFVVMFLSQKRKESSRTDSPGSQGKDVGVELGGLKYKNSWTANPLVKV